MKLTIIESPYAGDVTKNLAYARAVLRDSLLRGEAPLASHVTYAGSGALDDAVPVERQRGIAAGHAWMQAAYFVAVYDDLGISNGMKDGIEAAKGLGVPIIYRTIGWPR
jgi:hypothetical protein